MGEKLNKELKYVLSNKITGPSFIQRLWLLGAFREFVNKPFKENFNIIFMGNIKAIKINQLLFSFSCKKFPKIFPNPIHFKGFVNFSLIYVPKLTRIIHIEKQHHSTKKKMQN